MLDLVVLMDAFFPAFRTVLLLFFYDWFCVGLIWGSAYLIRPFALDELEV